MTVTLTPQNIILTASLVGALAALIAYFVKFVRWIDRHKERDDDLKALRAKHDDDMKELRESVAREFGNIASEQTLLTYGVLACLKGLKEQGCNGPVTEAINKIEEYLNKKAHDNEGGF